jgi:tetratricopeptide (TPR) repeat protein
MEGPSSLHRDRAALVEIHRRIECAAAALRDDGRATNNARLGERQRSIVVRCDLNGEPRKVVARDLGISTRQFSRDRSQAHLRVCAMLASQRSRMSVVADAQWAALAHAGVLYELGRTSAAVRQFKEIASNASSGLRSVQAMLALAEIDIDFDRFDAAERTVNSARHQLNRCGVEASGVARVAVLLGAAKLAVERGDVTEGDKLLDELELLLSKARPRAGAEIEVAAGVHCALAWRQSERGNLSTGLRYATRALNAIDSGKGPLVLREQLRHLQIVLSYHMGEIQRETARQDLVSLLRFAQSSGWLRQSAILFGALATDVNDSANAQHYCAEAKRLSRKHGSLQLRRIACLASSATALLNRNLTQARRDLYAWRRFGVSDAFQRVIAADIEAQLAMAAQAYPAALEHAGRAFSVAKSAGSSRAMGSTLRTMAMIELKRGNAYEAREFLDAAIPLIEGHGSPASLRRALLLRDEVGEHTRLQRTRVMRKRLIVIAS